MTKSLKIGQRVRARSDLKLQSKRSAFRGMPHVQGGDWLWLNGKPTVVLAGQRGTVVALPLMEWKYGVRCSNACLAVHWDTGEVTCMCRYDTV